MGYTWSGPDDVVAFVDPSQEPVAEVNRPDPVGDLLEADRVLLQGMGDEQPPRFQANGAGVGDPLHDEVPGIFDGPAARPCTHAVKRGRPPRATGRRAPGAAAPRCRGGGTH